MIRKVVQVYAQPNFTVYVYFADGIVKLYDVSPLIGKGIFQKISDPIYFVEKCTVINQTLAWDIAGGYNPYECIDIDPETIYTEGKTVPDPLQESA